MAFQPSAAERSFLTWTTVGVLGAVALFYLLREHRVHFLGWLPYVVLLACPLMHVFMHRGHSHKEGGEAGDARSNSHPHTESSRHPR